MELLLKDSDGAIFKASLYNQAPGGKDATDARAYLTAKFTIGARVVIAEPFFKIALDGQRMVRVDSPGEVQVMLSSSASVSRALDSREFLSLKQPLTDVTSQLQQGSPEEAVQTALLALHQSHARTVTLAVTLLSNRAQALLRLQQPASALRDAAAVLLLSPQHTKGWYRYVAALRALDAPAHAARAEAVTCEPGLEADVRDLSCAALPLPKTADLVAQACMALVSKTSSQQPQQGSAALRTQANACFNAGAFGEAAELYTSALARLDTVPKLARLLVKLAEACVAASSLHSALAVAAACCRLLSSDNAALEAAQTLQAQALLRLGEAGTCNNVLRSVSLTGSGSKRGMRAKLKEEAEWLQSNDIAPHSGAQHRCDLAVRRRV